MTDKEKEQLLELVKIAIANPATDKIVITLKPNGNCSKVKARKGKPDDDK